MTLTFKSFFILLKLAISWLRHGVGRFKSVASHPIILSAFYPSFIFLKEYINIMDILLGLAVDCIIQ